MAKTTTFKTLITGDIFRFSDEKYDNGYENVITNIENMTDEQMELWEELKGKVPNSSFMDKLEEKHYPSYKQWMNEKDRNITRIGWF